MVEQVTIQEEETTSEAPVEEAKAEEVVQEEQPQKLAGKFDSPEELEKGYKELEAKIGSKQKVEEAPKEPEVTKEETLEIDKAAEDAVEAAGLDVKSLEEEYKSNGALTEESYDKLAKIGLSKDIVDGYIDGQAALSQQIQTEVKSIAGGNEGYAEMMSWAKDNLSSSEINAYNNIVNGKDIGQTKLAVAGLKARMNETAEPNLIRGKAANVGTDAYDNWAQVSADMAKPEYANDPAEQARVQAKLAKSNL